MNVSTSGEGPDKLVLNAAYPRAIDKVGGKGLALPLGYGAMEEALGIADGVMLVGGPDYPPESYGEKNEGLSLLMHSARAEVDFALARRALELNKPVLGICGGAQLINIVAGGTLYQDLRTQSPGCLIHAGFGCMDPWHNVALSKESHLYSWIGEEYFGVNSYHHQAVKEPGRGVKLVAFAPDGVVEAAELLDEKNNLTAMAIQWHPEGLTDQPTGIAVFKGFIEWVKRGQTAG
jgi:putative glutamine amidotransferase